MSSPHTAYDDRWMADVMSRMRLRDAASNVEREFEAACPAVSRREIERAVDRSLSDDEWTRLRTWLRDEGARQLIDGASGVLSSQD